MTFDLTGLSIFLLAVLPGFTAQQSRYLIVPRSIEQKSTIEEMGDYILNSVLIHMLLVAVLLIFWHGKILGGISSPISRDGFRAWLWNHHWSALLYFLASLTLGPLLGFLRGIIALRQPIRSKVLTLRWCRKLLSRVGVHSFLEPDPVWYGVLKNNPTNELVFLQIGMKNGSRYTGELRSYGLVADKEKQKDFYIVNAYFQAPQAEEYRKLEVDGVLLSFSDADSIEVIKRSRIL
ncbi:MAG TPA: DUF6338 family protein [Candidatus Acidoferrum sp.]|jgi:hypothetical protein